jgi:hypothetical protein
MMMGDEFFGLGPSAFERTRPEKTQSISAYSVKWQGSDLNLPVFKINIRVLRYNLWNTRVKPHLNQYMAQNKLPENYFETIDKNSIETQRQINGFLRKNPDRKEAFKFFKNQGNKPEVQEPLVATPDGRILNGNQRLCVFRELYSSDTKKYSHLEMAYVAILPTKGTPQQERDLEATFQDTKLSAAMFDWVQQGLWLSEEKKKGKSNHAIGRIIGKSQDEVARHLRLMELATQFLKSINKEGYWVELRDSMSLRQAFKTLDEQIGKLKTVEEKNTLRTIAFRLMENPEKASKGKGTSVHLLIISAAKSIVDGQLVDGKKKTQSKPKTAILAPIKKRTAATRSKDEIDVTTVDVSGLADAIIDQGEIRKSKKAADNNKAYALRETKKMNTVLENIDLKLSTMELKGLKSQVNKAIKKLEKIKKQL